jgi:hypothetical protein
MARPYCAVEVNHKTGRDVGFRLRQAFGATSWAESGFALPLYFQNADAGRRILLVQLGQNALEFSVGLK